MAGDKLKILVADDSKDDLFIICDFLSKIGIFQMEVETESNYRQAEKKILLNKHDVYIVDHLLGPATGLELIEECIAAGIGKPFILLTGIDDKETDIAATKIGAYDFLSKYELSADQLERSLRYALQRYAAYMAIAESERRYREIFNKSQDIILVLNADFVLVNFNPMAVSLLGYARDELENLPLDKLFEYGEAAQKFTGYLASDEIKSEIEIVLLTKAGVRKIFLASFSKISGATSGMQYQGILHDYTDIKKGLDERLLKAKIDAKDNLIRSLAHEIRNPLTNINLSIDQLIGELTPDEKQLFIEIAKRNSQRINDLIVELVSQADASISKNEYVDVNEVVKMALSDAMDRINLKKIMVSENYSPYDMIVSGNSLKMRMAFLNIIINAVEAVKSDTGSLQIETRIEDNTAIVKISDNGPGIAEDDLKRLFSPYYTKKKNGMGLGLSNTLSVVQAHGGNIEVNSISGKGAAFTVKIEVAEATMVQSPFSGTMHQNE